MNNEYWKECIEIAAEECGLVISEEQLNYIADAVEGGHENYGMAFGYDVASANYISDEKRELEQLKRCQEKQRIWECKTVPCKTCVTTGTVRDGWGRDVICSDCGGKGRV